MADYSFNYDNTDDGTKGIPAYLAQAMQFYGTDKNSALPTDLSYPMNNQPGQGIFGGGAQFDMPQTPMTQAMGPQAPQGAIGQAMAPPSYYNAPQQPLAPQGRKDLNSIYDGLIAGGSAMLGAKNMKEGLAANGSAFNTAYDARTDKDRELNQPKVTPLADGAFSLLQFSNGTQKVVKNGDVAQYLTQKTADAATVAMQKVMFQGQVTNAIANDKENRKQADDANQALQGTGALMDSYQKAYDIVSKQGRGAQVAGAIPGIAGVVGGDTAAQNKFLSGLQVDTRLAESAKLKGAISNEEQKMLAEPVPSLTDDRETVWKPWLETRMAALKKVQDFQAQQAQKGDNPTIPKPGTPGTPASTPASNVDAATAEMRRRGFIK